MEFTLQTFHQGSQTHLDMKVVVVRPALGLAIVKWAAVKWVVVKRGKHIQEH